MSHTDSTTTGRDALLELCHRYIDQRDALYTNTVQPRRDTARALKALDEGRVRDAVALMVDVLDGLENTRQLYMDFGQEKA